MHLWQSTCLSLLRERHWPEHTLTHTRIHSIHSPFPLPHLLFLRSAKWVHALNRLPTDISPHHSFHRRIPIHLTHIIRVLSFVLVSTFECLFVCQEIVGLSVGDRRSPPSAKPSRQSVPAFKGTECVSPAQCRQKPAKPSSVCNRDYV